jgi:hypothetical protein
MSEGLRRGQCHEILNLCLFMEQLLPGLPLASTADVYGPLYLDSSFFVAAMYLAVFPRVRENYFSLLCNI